jgi:hypothetical protein
MKNSLTGNEIAGNSKCYFRTVLILVGSALVVLSGCSSLGGVASKESGASTVNKAYLQQNVSEPDPVADSPDPGYEWFY